MSLSPPPEDPALRAGGSQERPAPHGPPGLLAVLPRGETYRNFVYSAALSTVNKAVGAGALAVLPSPELRQRLRENVSYVGELKEIQDLWRVEILREVLDLAHCRWLWSAAAKDRWRRRETDVSSPAKRRRWRTKKAAAARFASRRGLRFLSRLERAQSRRHLQDDYYLRLLGNLRPAVVFNTSHVHSRNSIHAIQAAQWLGIHTAAFIFSWDNLTSQGRILLPYDSYLVWGEALKEDLLSMYPGVKPSQVHVTGTPQFDAHFQKENQLSREAFCQQVGADPARPIVLYSSGMPNHMPGEPELVESIADMLPHLGLKGPAPQLLVRVYAKDLTGRFDELKARRNDILFPEVPWEERWLTPLPEDTSLLTNTLRHAAVGINVASTVSLELCMFDVPVINVAYDPPRGGVPHLPYARYYDFDHYAKVVESGAVRLARSPEGMRVALKEEIERPEARSKARCRLLRSMFGETLDGRSADRVAEVLIQLVETERARKESQGT